MKNDSQLQISQNNTDKWGQWPVSSQHTGYLALAPASATRSNFSRLLFLRQVCRSQIICRVVSHFKVKQHPSSRLSLGDVSKPHSRELEIEQNELSAHSRYFVIVAETQWFINGSCSPLIGDPGFVCAGSLSLLPGHLMEPSSSLTINSQLAHLKMLLVM